MNEDQPDKQRLLFRSCYSKGVSHYHLHFGRDSMAGRRGGEKLYSGKKGKLWVCPDKGCWHGEATGGLNRSRASCVIGWVYIWLSLVVLKLEAGIKIRKLSIIDPVLAILD